MNYVNLENESLEAIKLINEYVRKNGSNTTFDSIKNQMDFIHLNAKNRKSPVKSLGGGKFTYAILASRELSSPEELIVKKQIDKVSFILDH